MLAERCAELVCNTEQGACDVDELLVVTFTESAAAEMKARIHAALRDRAAAQASIRLTHQLALVDQANVSTLHGFCARVLRQHFHLAGLDPSFAVLDAEEAKLLRSEVARDLFADRFELDASGDFQRFVDAYGEGDDARLIRQVIKTHEMLCSLIDPAAWVGDAWARLEEAAKLPLRATHLGGKLDEEIQRGLSSLDERCAAAIEQLRRVGGFEGYVAQLKELSRVIGYWRKAFADAGVDGLSEVIGELQIPSLPRVPETASGKAIAKAAVDSVRSYMKDGSWREMLRFSSAQWKEGMIRILPHANVFLELLEQFGTRYRAAKGAARVVDFSDLERETLKVLREPGSKALAPSPAARAMHRRFKHVLVDEYQDINEVQDAILSLVSRECVREEPGQVQNLFCVGDVKQSIYRFRLAEPTRFLERQRSFRNDAAHRYGQVIDLQANFRSRPALLEAINGVFERLMTAEAVDIEYDQSHLLQPGQEYPPGDGKTTFRGAPIELHLLPSKLSAGDEESGDASEAQDLDLDRTEREAVLVAKRIRELMGMDGKPGMSVMQKEPGGAMSQRSIRFGDIAILLRSMRFKADQFADILERAGIPVHSESGTGYFESMEVRDMLSLLSLLDNQRQDVPFAGVLRSPLAGFAQTEDSLARIRLAYDRDVPFHEAAVRYAEEKDDELAARLREFFKELSAWRDLAQRRPLAELIATIYERTGYLAFCAGLIGGEQRCANLRYLHERAAQFGAFHRQGLSRFMQFLENLRAESDLGQPSVASEADDVVRIMSVHQSKGLEFPVVILPDLGKAINLEDCRGSILVDRQAGLGMAVVDEEKQVRYPSLASTLVKSRLRQQALAEEMRVLYVAMTRAKEHLILVGTAAEDAAQQWAGRWAGHEGPLPAEYVRGVSSMLDWIGPAAAASDPRSVIEFIIHGPEEVGSWASYAEKVQTLTAVQARMAQLEPLSPAPEADEVARELIERLSFQYPYEAYSKLPAAETVTGSLIVDEANFGAAPRGGGLVKPRFQLDALPAAASDVGDAVHLVLRHLDFAASCDAADVTRQVNELVESRMLTSGQALSVDPASIAWLMKSDVGRLLREGGKKVRRELPVHFPRPALAEVGPAEEPAPMDRVMVRGRLDALVPSEQGLVLIDYKTDRVGAEEVAQRAEIYRPQMEAYAGAIEAISGKPVVRVLLVFLTPRVVHAL